MGSSRYTPHCRMASSMREHEACQRGRVYGGSRHKACRMGRMEELISANPRRCRPRPHQGTAKGKLDLRDGEKTKFDTCVSATLNDDIRDRCVPYVHAY